MVKRQEEYREEITALTEKDLLEKKLAILEKKKILP